MAHVLKSREFTERRFSVFMVACAIASFLLVSCSSVPSRSGATASTGGIGKSGEPENSSLTEEQLEQRIQSSAHFATGLSYEFNSQPERALEEFWQAAMGNPAHEALVIDVTRRLMRAQKPEKAIELLKQAQRSRNGTGAIEAWLGLAYARAGKTDEAIKANRAAIQKAPQNLLPYQSLVQLFVDSKKYEQAYAVLEQAAEQDSKDAEYWVNLGELFARLASVPEQDKEKIQGRAVRMLDRAVELKAQSAHLLQRLGDLYMASGQPAKAEAQYEALFAKHGMLPGIQEKLVDVYLRLGKRDQAARRLEELARENPTNPQPYVFLASIALEEKQYERAAEYLERALLLSPELEDAYYELAGLKLTLQKPAEALALLQKAREQFKLNFVLEFYTGMTQAALKNFTEAVKHLTSAEIIAKTGEPQRLTPQFYFQYGAALERSGDTAGAEDLFEKALKISPDFAEALNYLGYMWADLGVNLDEAHRLLSKAVQLEPKNAAFLDSLGWVLFKLKKLDEARTYILQAVEGTEEPDPVLYDHLGDVYAAQEKFEEARAAWEKALKIEPNDQAEQIKKKLETLRPAQTNTP